MNLNKSLINPFIMVHSGEAQKLCSCLPISSDDSTNYGYNFAGHILYSILYITISIHLSL